MTLNPNIGSTEEHDVQHVQKNQAYYDDMDINMEDLSILEQRVEELERYVGCEGFDMEYFIKQDIEKLDSKCNRLDDFTKVIEDKNFLLNDLFVKYDQLENFLKNGNKFQAQCINLSQRSMYVVDSADNLNTYAKNLKEMN